MPVESCDIHSFTQEELSRPAMKGITVRAPQEKRRAVGRKKRRKEVSGARLRKWDSAGGGFGWVNGSRKMLGKVRVTGTSCL